MQRCGSDVFVEHLYLPSVRCGGHEHLQDAMTTLDATLVKWSQHLTALCRYLTKNKKFNILYDVQLFMKVSANGMIVMYLYVRTVHVQYDFMFSILYVMYVYNYVLV